MEVRLINQRLNYTSSWGNDKTLEIKVGNKKRKEPRSVNLKQKT